ncbi:MAG TPA: ribosome maturation factor RimP [Burkholderiales bacterium]
MSALEQLLDRTVTGLGYRLADFDFSNRNRLLRVFIEKTDGTGNDAASGVGLDDCEIVTRQLQRVLPVEGIDYDRLEVSSPGLDRRLKSESDFERFAGHRADVRLRVPVNGRRNFVGTLRGVRNGRVELDFDGGHLDFDLADMDRARLVPEL